MKKIFLSMMLLMIIATSCRKDRSTRQGDVTQKVQFKIGFSQSSLGWLSAGANGSLSTNALTSNADTALANHFNELIYLVFDSNGEIYHRIFQKKDDPSFGHYADNLLAGNYTIAVIAGYGLTLNNGAAHTVNSMFVTVDPRMEVFFKKFTLTVGETPIVNNVLLHRVTSYLAINFKDPIPQGANSIDLFFAPDGFKFYLGSETPQLTNQGEILLPVVPNGKPNQQVGSILFLSESQPIDIKISVLNTDSDFRGIYFNTGIKKLYAQKQLYNVPGKVNSVTTLSGYMFSEPPISGNGFKVTIDTAWAAPINKNF